MASFKRGVVQNFSFNKLSKNLDKVIDNSMRFAGRYVVNHMKGQIRGGDLPKLKPFSIKMRESGVYWGKKRVTPTNRTEPLFYTGKLHDSIKYDIKKKELSLNGYGKMHNDGFTNQRGTRVESRPFIDNAFEAANEPIVQDNIRDFAWNKDLKKYFNTKFRQRA